VIEPMSVRHTLGCMIARVAGRSPLEYLDDSERVAQKGAVLAAMARHDWTMPALIDHLTASATRA
jgi:hypothetical protein